MSRRSGLLLHEMVCRGHIVPGRITKDVPKDCILKFEKIIFMFYVEHIPVAGGSKHIESMSCDKTQDSHP